MTIASRNVGQVMPMVGLDTLRRGWGWFLALGIVLIVLGIFAVGWAAVVTVASVIIFGWLLIAGGVMQAADGPSLRTGLPDTALCSIMRGHWGIV